MMEYKTQFNFYIPVRQAEIYDDYCSKHGITRNMLFSIITEKLFSGEFDQFLGKEVLESVIVEH